MILYSTAISPPCRAVLMAADLFGIDLDVREVNLDKAEQMAEHFKIVIHYFLQSL